MKRYPVTILLTAVLRAVMRTFLQLIVSASATQWARGRGTPPAGGNCLDDA